MRKIILYGVILFQIGLIIALVRGVQLSRRSISRIALMEETKVKLEAEKEKLQQQEEYVNSPYYLEKVARDELGLAKTGERVVIVPEGTIIEASSQKLENGKREKANWQKWLAVLSGKI